MRCRECVLHKGAEPLDEGRNNGATIITDNSSCPMVEDFF